MNSFLGIDIGGTGVKLALLDESWRMIAADDFSTDSVQGLGAFLQALKASLMKMKAAVPGAEVLAAGIGCTGPVNVETGIVENPFTLPELQGVCLIDPVREILGMPVFLENDANTAHLGEASALGTDDPGDTALITLGTGVGCSVRMGYRLFSVPGGVHPEMGHTSCGIDSDIRCYCGKTGCMENILSGTAVNRDAKRFFGCTPEAVFEHPDTDDKKLFCENIIQGLFNSVTTLSGIFNSRVIIIAGGMTEFYKRYALDELNRRFAVLEPGISVVPRAIPARLGKNSGRIGAAILAEIGIVRDGPNMEKKI